MRLIYENIFVVFARKAERKVGTIVYSFEFVRRDAENIGDDLFESNHSVLAWRKVRKLFFNDSCEKNCRWGIQTGAS